MKHVLRGLATLLGGFLTISYSAHAQSGYAGDALLYMRQNPSGTARTLGLAGANVSLGADFGNLTSNPAGLGFYTKSEVTLTPGVGFGTDKAGQIANSAAYPNSSFPSLSQNANSFHIASAGVVFTNRRPDSDQSSDWRGGSFALGFTRLADFNQSFRYQSTTDDNHSFFQRLREPYGNADYNSSSYQTAVNDIQNQYLNSSQGSQYINIDGLALGTGLVDHRSVVNPNPGAMPGDSLYQLATPRRRGAITQNETVKSTGSLSQFDLGYGGNYRDKLYVGGGVGIVSLNRTRTATFSESSNNGTGDPQDFLSQDYLKTTGTGINARLGFIYKVADEFRLGGSIQTPTYIRLTDVYSTTLTANTFYAATALVQATPTLITAPGSFDYSITTPFRANGGATVLLSKYGFLTADIEYVGYSSAKFNTIDNSSDAGLDYANSTISNGYQNVVNYRVGAEGRFNILRARLGFAYYADPYKNSSYGRAQKYYTAGVGVRTKQFFVDLAGVYLDAKDQYQPYSLATRESPTINITQNRFTASLTGGLIF